MFVPVNRIVSRLLVSTAERWTARRGADARPGMRGADVGGLR
jgi:hypothetical protein